MTEEEKKKKKQLELKIFDLNAEIDREILSGEDDLPETVKELRHRVLYVHSLVESYLDFMINIKLYFTANTDKEEAIDKKLSKILDFRKLMIPIADQMIFSRKVRISQEMELINKDQEKLANQLNDIRNKLSHVKNRTPNPYIDLEKQHEALVITNMTLKEFQKKSKEPLKVD